MPRRRSGGACRLLPAGRVLSPGGHVTCRRSRPGSHWLPEDATPRLDLVPLWAKAGYRLPGLRGRVRRWMWRHGGFEVTRPFGRGDDGGLAGVREPRRPYPPQGSGWVTVD